MSRHIFISYRRADSEGYAGRLFDRLSSHFGVRNIFMDVAAIEAGVNFAKEIEQAVRACDVLLALIGPQWLTIKDAQGNLATAYRTLGEVRKAIEGFEQVLAIAREIGDRRTEARTLGDLGISYRDLGELRTAIEFYEQCLAIARETGDRRGEGSALGNLGNAYRNLGEVHKALEFYEQDLAIAREIGDRSGEGNVLFNMGLALRKLEEKERAIQLVSQALEVYKAIESPNTEKARKKLKEWGV